MTSGIRQLHPSDYWPVISVIDHWWNGRHMADQLPRLFFEHFTDTSFAAEHDGELIGFLVGFVSQSHPAEAYIHFVGVHPAHRGRGLGRQLYQRFFAAAHARGGHVVRAVTAPVNQASIRFHVQMGFDIEPGDSEVDGIPVTSGYDGDRNDRVRFVKDLTTRPTVPRSLRERSNYNNIFNATAGVAACLDDLCNQRCVTGASPKKYRDSESIGNRIADSAIETGIMWELIPAEETHAHLTQAQVRDPALCAAAALAGCAVASAPVKDVNVGRVDAASRREQAAAALYARRRDE